MKEINMIASSEPGQASTSPDGSRFTVKFDEALRFPRTAYNITLTADQSTVWWVVPNVITGVNDTMYITGPDTLDVVQNYVVVIAQGLYDLSGLESAIQRELEIQGAKIDPDPLISLLPDAATSRVVMRLNYLTVAVDFTQPQTPRGLLGFNALVYTNPPVTHLAENVAAFNTVDYFLIHCDLVNQGIRFNNSYNQTIMQAPITVAPGSQNITTPFNPPRIDASNLVGQVRNQITFWVTDQANRPINTNGEIFSVRIAIRYEDKEE